MKIQHVPLEWAPQTWPKVAGFVEAALAFAGGDYNTGQVQTLVNTGQMLLVVALDDDGFHGAAVVQLFNRPTQRVAFVIAIGGKLISSKDTYHQFSELLKAFGATHIEGAARESIARLGARYGLAEKYRIVGAEL